MPGDVHLSHSWASTVSERNPFFYTLKFRCELRTTLQVREKASWPDSIPLPVGCTSPSVVNFFLVEAETRRRWDIFQAEVTLYWELAVRRCSHPSLTIAQHSRVYTFQGGGIHRGGDNLNKACKCSTGISPLPEFPQPWPHQHNSVIQMHRC